MRVRITAMSADIKMEELGHGGGDDAVEQFLRFPWGEALLKMRQLEAENAAHIISPDMTFTALPAHLIVQAEDEQRFNVEVCLPRLKKLFGIFSRVKFYTFNQVSRDAVGRMLEQFCADDLEQTHRYFAELRSAATSASPS